MMACTRSRLLGPVTVLALALTPGAAHAQAGPGTPAKPAAPQVRLPPPAPLPPLVTIGFSGGYQPSTTTFDDSFTFPLHQETGTTRTTYAVEAGPLFDGGVGVRLWKRLGAGIAVSFFEVDGTVSAASSVPHPFFLDQPRTVEGEAGGVRRTETAVHLQAQYSLPLRGRLQVTLAGGPTVIQAEQALVLDVNYAETYPYDTATFAGVDTAGRSASATGFNAGVDVRYMFTRAVGAGGFVRFTRASVQLDAADRTVSFDAGGTQAGVGIRIALDRRRAPGRPRK